MLIALPNIANGRLSPLILITDGMRLLYYNYGVVFMCYALCRCYFYFMKEISHCLISIISNMHHFAILGGSRFILQLNIVNRALK